MARNLKAESEFGLPVLPRPDGSDVPVGATGPEAITALTDADAIKADADTGTLYTLGAELRKIYAVGEGELGPGSVAANQGG